MTKPCRKCGQIPKTIPSRYKRGDYECNACHRAYCKARPYKGGKASQEWWVHYRKEYYSNPINKKRIALNMKRYRQDPLLRFKHEARWILNKAVKRGIIKKMPCFCGSILVQAHHPNYKKPLEVVWLCRQHHAKAEGK